MTIKDAALDKLAQALLAFTEKQAGASPYSTPIEGVAVLRSDMPKPPTPMISKPALCIVAQGAKWATIGGTRLEYRAGQALVIGVETPSTGRVVEARPDQPCLVLAFHLNPAIMRDVAAGLDPAPQPRGEVGRGVFVTDFQGPLADCALRLVRLFDTPQAIGALYPGIMREIAFWLLTGPHGREIARLTLANGPSQRLLDSLNHLRDHFAEPFSVQTLAATAQMSVSAFHRQFKALTSLTPLQYQKQLRLLEARRLMISRAFNVETAAFQVGYESPSQFSREYVRMFGQPPKRDVSRLQASLTSDRPMQALNAA